MKILFQITFSSSNILMCFWDANVIEKWLEYSVYFLLQNTNISSQNERIFMTYKLQPTTVTISVYNQIAWNVLYNLCGA